MRHEVRVAPFWPEDVEAIDPVAGLAPGSVGALVASIAPEHARTAFHGSDPVGAAGVIPLWPGVGSAWALVDRRLPLGLVRAFLDAARRAIPEVVRQGPFHRIQADVRRDFVKGRRFVLALGFTYEGPLDAYGADGTDYDRFSLVDRELIRG